MDSGTIYFLLIIVFVASLIASGRVNRVFKRYDSLSGALGVTAAQAASDMLYTAGASVSVSPVLGQLTDHYNPSTQTVGLSTEVYGNSSVSALAVAAHEIGHVCQHMDGYAALSFRSKILPVAKIGSVAGPYIIIGGLLIQSTNIAYIGLYLYAAMFLFQLVTLPVEFNASSRGLSMLREGGYVKEEDMPAAKKVLRAAAMTYVLSAIASLLSVLRFAAMISGSKRKD